MSCCWLFVFDEESILLMFSTEVQALWAGVVGVSPLPNVLVKKVPKWVFCLFIVYGLAVACILFAVASILNAVLRVLNVVACILFAVSCILNAVLRFLFAVASFLFAVGYILNAVGSFLIAVACILIVVARFLFLC